MPIDVRKPLILAVDDSLDNLALLQFQVNDVIECDLMTATTGERALALAQRRSPDLVLMDILLPDIDGTEVVRQLRNNTETAKTPIVALTALARLEDRDRILNSGCNDYLSKPYDIDDLEAIIARHLMQHSLL